jgi:excisionase family DNA binding protein
MDSEIIDLAAMIAAKLQENLEKNFHVIPTLTLSQAAEAVGVSDEKMRQLCNDGQIPFIRMDRLYRIKPADVNAYLERNYHAK